jgi:PTH1 family peptidyl-tRNA hydrolase
MKIIVGLGNPGRDYQASRHNIGFMLIDKYAISRKLAWNVDGNVSIAHRKTFKLLKPLTYMNLSGRAVSRYTDDPTELLVICDDIYLPFGEVRLRAAGGDGGHNGLTSIITELATVAFNRMRIGVGQPTEDGELSHFVLENFNENEFKLLEKTSDFVVKLIDCFIANGFQSMLDLFSKSKKSYSESLLSESQSKGGKINDQ